MNIPHARSRDCSEPAGPFLSFVWPALAQTLKMLPLPANDSREVRDHDTFWAGSYSVCIAPEAEASPEEQNGEEKKLPCPCGLWILPCASSGLSSLPQCTALCLLSVFGLRQNYHSWFPKTGLGRTNICPEPPCTLFKTVFLNKFCRRVQSILERNENLTSTSGGFGSGLTCLFLLLVQSLGFLPWIHWE